MAPASIGQALHLLEMFAGVSKAQLQRLIESGLISMLLDVPEPQLVDKSELAKLLGIVPPGTFKSPQAAFGLLHRHAHQYGWFDKLPENDWTVVRERLPESHPGGLRIIAFEVWLGDLATTIEALMPHLRERMELLLGRGVSMVGAYGPRPFIAVYELDLGSLRGVHLDYHSGAELNAAGLELLTLPLLHPEWARSMGQGVIRPVCLPGLRIGSRMPIMSTVSGLPLVTAVELPNSTLTDVAYPTRGRRLC